ncbi:MAG: amylo-alpha-1,6-glucosidase, partial [Planctomycetia bacterium]|nr:amylo-alpha-1,6-glucosidase [Planctomycetia bacterium]
YHWFGDWGRDTMIALPGLTLATGRFEVARQILETFVSAAGEGMIPNNFSEETGEPQFNSVDASLWFIQAAQAYLQAAADADFVRERLWPVIVAIVGAYARGTRFGIGTDSDGLITAGDENTQLTWMDAKSGGRPVTPRHGKAVEVNALWVSGLRIVAQIACELKRNPPAVCSSADAVAAAFEEAFWNEAKGCLYDCIGPDGKADDAVRPNQILAVSLPCAPLSGARAAGVVRVVREKLYTPFGLRTLAPDEPGYSARYEGGPDERDAAYHQGTVWPWLLGPFIEACLKVGGFSDKVRAECREMLAAVLENLDAAGLGSISEIFDAEPPHTPRGCIAQAWSVAEVLRAWKLLQTGPA